jgi:uncharacterized repeat protein (TIGR03803 family)
MKNHHLIHRLLLHLVRGLLLSLLVAAAFGQFEYWQLRSFTDSGGDGASPDGTLVEGNGHALYGVTSGGGSNDIGTVFKIDPDGGQYALLHNFTASDGAVPRGPLLRGSDGALYGTTSYGGANNVGTVFKLNQDGSDYAVLLNFSSTNGEIWPSALIQGSDGALYGTTRNGGKPDPSWPDTGLGTVFKLNRDGGDYVILHEFDYTVEDGAYPGGVIEASDGMLYGGTDIGGTDNAGTLFTLNKDGGAYRILRDFSGTSQSPPQAALLEGSDGALYWSSSGVFKINKDGSGCVMLHGLNVTEYVSALVLGADGALYGTTAAHRINQSPPPRTVFRMNQDGSGYEVLPVTQAVQIQPTGLVQGSDGSLYGTTVHGGDLRFGTVYALRPKPTMLPPTFTSDGIMVRFMSMPGSTHQLQRANTVEGPWLTLATLIVPANGVAEFTNRTTFQPSGFYRTMSP